MANSGFLNTATQVCQCCHQSLLREGVQSQPQAEQRMLSYLGNTTFHFLGAPVVIHATSVLTRENLSTVLQKVDEVPIHLSTEAESVQSCHLSSTNMGPHHL